VTDPNVPYEKRPDGLLFHLRDDVRAVLRWNSQTSVEVELWRKEILLPPEVGNINSGAFRKRLAKIARDAFGASEVPSIEEDLGRVALALRSREEDSEKEGEKGKTLFDVLKDMFGPSPMELLIKYTREAAELFHDSDMKAYATIKIAGHGETYSLRTTAFKLWIRSEFWRREKERLEEEGEEDPIPMVLRRQTIEDALSQLEALAFFEGPEYEVHVRVAGHEGVVFVDLADELWNAVRIDSTGWSIVADPPVRFIRPAGVQALPAPRRGGSPATLKNLLNIPNDDEGRRNWRLILAWLAQAFMPRGPYPIITLLGPQGAAKSTAARILRSVVDPSSVPLRSMPRDEHNLYIDGTSSWCVALDNVSTLPTWLSDALCRLATGGGFSTRTLYTDRDQQLFEAMRPVILNGIGDVVTRPDLLDRALIVNLPAIPKDARRLERKLYAELERAMPEILGFIFDAIVGGLAGVDKVELDELPRMADFARWGAATEKALGGEPGSFMAAYEESQAEGVQTALENWPIVPPLWKFAILHEEEENAWVGTPSELFVIMNERPEVSDEVKRSPDWPKAANALTAQINRLAPSLREVGVYVEKLPGSRRGGRKLQVFHHDPTRERPLPSSPSSPGDKKPSKSQNSGGDDPWRGDGLSSGGDDHSRGTVADKTPANRRNGDGGDGGDDDLQTSPSENGCIHGLPGGKGCYICDPDHPARRGSA
jgi:hypothetical protein